MHFDHGPDVPSLPHDDRPWYAHLTRYHWFVLVVSALGWMFDCFDQQLFNLARGPAIRELRGAADVPFWGGLATTIFMIGWATGGVIFGIMGDKIGRAKTMLLTILLYSAFTGLSALSTNFWDFAAYRFLTGLGVGGEFAVGIALVAEVMPPIARSQALGWLQALSAVGNVSAALVSMGLSRYETAAESGQMQPWRWMFIIGALPALLAVLIRRKLKEPEAWVALRAAHDAGTQKLGSIRELLGNPRWRKNALLGLVLATSGVVGLWGIGFFSFDLTRAVLRDNFEKEIALDNKQLELDRQIVQQLFAAPNQVKPTLEKVKPDLLYAPDAKLALSTMAGLEGKHAINLESITTALEAAKVEETAQREALKLLTSPASSAQEDIATLSAMIGERTQKLNESLTFWAGMNGLLFNFGAFFGIYSFSRVTHYLGRKPTFAITFVLAFIATAYTFMYLSKFSDIFWMVPIMGFCQIALFGGYAIYFPELFPTRLRSTGTSFCYNVGRYLAAAGPLSLGILASSVFGHYGKVMSWRYAGITMCVFFLLGLVVLPFLPETKGKPLPE